MKEVFTYLLLFSFLLNGFCLNAKETFTVTGEINLNSTYDLDVMFDRMEKADIKSPQEFNKLFLSLRESLPRIKYDKVTVYLSGNGIVQKTKLINQYGAFRFDQVPCGEYTITAEAPFSSSVKTVSFQKLSVSNIVSEKDKFPIILILRLECVNLKGRLIDQNGSPIANGMVIVTTRPFSDYHAPPTWRARSNHDGFFEINGVTGAPSLIVSSYLTSEKVHLGGAMAKIRFSAEGYQVPKKYHNFELPMVSEDIVERAKRLIPFGERLLKQWKRTEKIKFLERTFPPSQGNTIFLGDIILSRNTAYFK